MYKSTVSVLSRLLTSNGYPIDKRLKLLYSSHPDVETIAAVTATLSDLEIENMALNISPTQLEDLTAPFLGLFEIDKVLKFGVVKRNAGEIEVYIGDKTLFLTYEKFKVFFTGAAVVIDKNEDMKSNGSSLRTSGYGIVAILLFLCLCFFSTPVTSLWSWVYFFLSCAGIIVSALIVNESIGLNSPIVTKLCSLSEKVSCNTVLNSSSAYVIGSVSWSDIGIVYFTAQLFAFTFLPITRPLLCWFSIFSSLFSIYSLYQQSVVIKKWCPLCIIVIMILVLQAIVSVVPPFLSYTNITADLLPNLLRLIATTAMGVGSWYFLKPFLQMRNDNGEREVELLSFKRNYHLFLPYYQSSRQINGPGINYGPEIIFGAPQAPVQITLITNPLCSACKNAHKAVNEILLGRADINLRLIFYVPAQIAEDPRTITAGFLTQAFFKDKCSGLKAIEEWYENPSPKKNSIQNGNTQLTTEVKAYLLQQQRWCIANELTLTPTILINKRLFPVNYQVSDLKYHIDEIVAVEREKIEMVNVV